MSNFPPFRRQIINYTANIHSSNSQPSLPTSNNFRISPISQILGFGSNNETDLSTIQPQFSQNAIIPPSNKTFRPKMLKMSTNSSLNNNSSSITEVDNERNHTDYDLKRETINFNDNLISSPKHPIIPTLIIPENHNGYIIHSHPQLQEPEKIESPHLKYENTTSILPQHSKDSSLFYNNFNGDINSDFTDSSPSPSICPSTPISPIFEILNYHPPLPGKYLSQSNDNCDIKPDTKVQNQNILFEKLATDNSNTIKCQKKKLLRVQIPKNEQTNLQSTNRIIHKSKS